MSFYMLTKFFTALIFQKISKEKNLVRKIGSSKNFWALNVTLHAYTCHGHLADTFPSEDDDGNVISVR